MKTLLSSDSVGLEGNCNILLSAFEEFGFYQKKNHELADIIAKIKEGKDKFLY